MPKVFTSKSQILGELGEGVAVQYLRTHGYAIVERNYTKPCGEIDIIARKGETVSFVEVKSQTTAVQKKGRTGAPEENMHSRKVQRRRKTIRQYIGEHFRNRACTWQFDLIIVYLDMERRTARVSMQENIIL